MAINPALVGIVAGAEATETTTTIKGTPFPDSVGDGYDGHEGPDYSTALYDVLVLNGRRVPGISRVKVVPKMRIDVPKTVNHDGGPTIERGHEAARVDITIRYWTPSQWVKLQEVLRAIWRPPGKPVPDGNKKAVLISHPACAPPWNISAILLESVESPEPSSEGGWVIKIKAVQYIAPKKRPVAKKAEGKGVAIAAGITQAKNGVVPGPSKTAAVPKLPPRPNQAPIRP